MKKTHINRLIMVVSIILLFLGLFLLQPKPKLMAPGSPRTTITES